MRTNDIVAGIVLIAAASLMIVLTANFPAFIGQKYGPSLFPRILGSGLILCGVLLVRRGVVAHRAGAPWLVRATWTRDPWRLGAFLLIPGSVITYILVSETIGFLPVAFAVMVALFVWLGTRPLVALPVAAASVWAIHYFFAGLMRVPLPRGILMNIL